MTMLQDDSALLCSTTLAELPHALADRFADAPRWRQDLRDAGLAAFAEQGVPTRSDEEWRQMNLKAINELSFSPAVPAEPNAASLEQVLLPGLDAVHVVFVNGRLSAALSTLDAVPAGVTIASIEPAAELNDDRPGSAIGSCVDLSADPFAALNAAMFDHGLRICVEPNGDIARAIHVLHVVTEQDRPCVISPRLLIEVGQSSRLTVIEDCITLGDNAVPTLTNLATEIIADANSHVRHYLIERQQADAFVVANRDIRAHRDCNVEAHSIMYGASIVRNNINPVVDGEGSHCVLNGVYIGNARQQQDTHVQFRHAVPNCTSNQFFRGILTEKSSGSFTGRIIVERPAQKTDAVQSSQHLLLSDDARAHSKPQLEIFADDVRCTHGATIGQLDADGLFYLKSRGMSDGAARSLLVYAYASESIDMLGIEPIKQLVREALIDRLPNAAALRDLA